MADQKVLQVQQWLLDTYGTETAFAQFVSENEFTATGNTGTNTMSALIYALQYELGIDEPTGSFGSQTLSLVPSMSLENVSSYSTHLIKILEGGLWCHGYSAGYDEDELSTDLDGSITVDFGGTFDEDTVSAINVFQTDIGLDPTGVLIPLQWKALLSTDAFVTTWSGGSGALREAQQYLNWVYINGYNFAKEYMQIYIPCDGLNSRAFSKALIYYLQAIIGLPPATSGSSIAATGNLGEVTQSGLITIPTNLPTDVTISRHYVRAVVFSLLANGYSLSINSYWSTETENAVKEFQEDMSLNQSGIVDFTTWMALLISYGDKNRSYTACDTRFEITDERLATLQSMGIEAVGRYINGTDFKILRDGEAERIIAGGLGLIPIYQESGTSASDFTYNIGSEQAGKALIQLANFGIPKNSIIYFAVDYDALGSEITSNIIPYFQGIYENLPSYQVGVYGTRNVCSQVVDAGYAVTCYVSNMSSGYSGNLGFKMPTNWNFDQFDEIEIDDWGIDKVVYSEKFSYVSSITEYDDIEDISSEIQNNLLTSWAEELTDYLNIDSYGLSLSYKIDQYQLIYNTSYLMIYWVPSATISYSLNTEASVDTLTLSYSSESLGTNKFKLSLSVYEKIEKMATGAKKIFTGYDDWSLFAGFSDLLESIQADAVKVKIISMDIYSFTISLLFENAKYTKKINGITYQMKLSHEFVFITNNINYAFTEMCYNAYQNALQQDERESFVFALVNSLTTANFVAKMTDIGVSSDDLLEILAVSLVVLIMIFIAIALGEIFVLTVGELTINAAAYVIAYLAAIGKGIKAPLITDYAIS